MSRSRRVVVVDDEPNIGRSLRLILEGEGYSVTVCDSAAQFQAERRRARADLYLLDVSLPDGNGIDLLRSFPQAEDSTPVVMISGNATIRDAVDATHSGRRLLKSRLRATGSSSWRRTPSPIGRQRENQRFRELVATRR
jgi:DNA-binding NtrC family response regulator